MINKLFSMLAVTAMLTACGGGGDSESTLITPDAPIPVVPTPVEPMPTESKTGTFSGIEGLSYSSGESSGITDENGSFEYEVGKVITFKIGDIVIGQTNGGATLTLSNLGDTESVETNITRLLNVLDDDANPDNGIQIIDSVRELAMGAGINFNQTISEFINDVNVQAVVATLTEVTSAGARMITDDESSAEQGMSNGKTFLVLEETPPITTHTIESGYVKLGISDQGGGYINLIDLPGFGDIMGSRTDGYGRGGQAAIRDSMHGGKYNPTMAGFTDRAGTRSEILSTDNKLTVVARPSSLWNGDGKYDFTEWENLAADPYQSDNGSSDIDGIDESNLEGQQAAEVTSEFDYYGEYENCIKTSGGAPCFRVYFEYRSARPPGHAISQFSSTSSVFNANLLGKDISNQWPKGDHLATEFDMSGLVWAMTLRADTAIWNPKYRMMLNAEGEWEAQERTSSAKLDTFDKEDHKPLLVLSHDNTPDQGMALGLYWPNHDVNKFDIVGRRGEEEVYRDKRQSQRFFNDEPERAAGLHKFGFGFRARGILNPINTPEGIYEALRGEMYILVGTPNEIREAANNIHPM